MFLHQEDLDELEYMIMTEVSVFYDAEIEKINDIVEKVNLLLTLTNQNLKDKGE